MGQKASTAIVDIDFLLGSHHKVAKLGEIHLRRYLALWGLATKLNRELLPEAYTLDNLTQLEQITGVGRGRYRLKQSLEIMAEQHLIGFVHIPIGGSDDSGWVYSCGGLICKSATSPQPLCDKSDTSLQPVCNHSASIPTQSGRFVADLTQTGSTVVADLKRIVVVGLADRYESRNIIKYEGPLCFALYCYGLLCREGAAPKRGVDNSEHENESTKSGVREGKDTTTPSSGKRSRAPTAVEKEFEDGFRSKYGYGPEIDKGHAVRLASLVGKHGADIVVQKIKAWWDSPAGNWVKQGTTRDIAAFLSSFGRIDIAGPRSGSGGDRSRYDAATIQSGPA